MSAERLELAEKLSRFAHAGQVDKGGNPYYLHPLAVSEKLRSEDDKIVGLLHDVLEDTEVKESTIRDLFGDTVADAVVSLTHREGEAYEDYVERASRNEIARRVKRADVENNMDLSRISIPGEKDIMRLDKYKKALQILDRADSTMKDEVI